MRVLVAEDDRDVASMLKALLESTGHEVTCVDNGDEALELYRAQGADVVILDILLPGRNGFQIAESIRAAEVGADVPIIMLSGVYLGPEYGEQARRRFGAVRYLEKPVESVTLLEAFAAAESQAEGDVGDLPDEHTDLSAEPLPSATLPDSPRARAPDAPALPAAGAQAAPQRILAPRPTPPGLNLGEIGQTGRLLTALQSPDPEPTDRRQVPVGARPALPTLAPPASAKSPRSEPQPAEPAPQQSPALHDPASLREQRAVERSVSRASRMAAHGDLRFTPFPVLLHRLHREHASGALLLVRNPVKKIVYFRDGTPVFVKSNLLSECLGKVLVRERLITEPQCRESLRLLQETKRKQGALLSEMGAISQPNLLYGLQLQLRTKLYEIFSWPQGEYRFSARTRPPDGATQLEMNSLEIIFEGIRLYFDPERLKQELGPSLDLFIELGRDSARGLASLPLTAGDHLVVAAINGARSLRELLARAPAGPGSAAQLLYSLLCTEIVATRTQPIASTEPENVPEIGTETGDELPEELTATDRPPEGRSRVEVATWTPPVRDSDSPREPSAPERLTNAEPESMAKEELDPSWPTDIDAQVERMLWAEHHFQRAEGLLDEHRFEDALRCIRRANTLCPHEGEFTAILGWALFLAGGESAAEDALGTLQQAIEQDPKLERAYLFRGQVRKAIGRIEDAAADFELALSRNPECTEAQRELEALRPAEDDRS